MVSTAIFPEGRWLLGAFQVFFTDVAAQEHSNAARVHRQRWRSLVFIGFGLYRSLLKSYSGLLLEPGNPPMQDSIQVSVGFGALQKSIYRGKQLLIRSIDSPCQQLLVQRQRSNNQPVAF